jgi:hypothetical protein
MPVPGPGNAAIRADAPAAASAARHRAAAVGPVPAASPAIADTVGESRADFNVPSVFDPALATALADAVRRAADTGGPRTAPGARRPRSLATLIHEKDNAGGRDVR